MNTRSLILNTRNEFVIPNKPPKNRITFDTEIEGDIPHHSEVEKALQEEYGLWPLHTRRALGGVMCSSAFILTPPLGKNVARNFIWRSASLNTLESEMTGGHLDDEDSRILKRTIELSSELGLR
jgi:hypothetical protein